MVEDNNLRKINDFFHTPLLSKGEVSYTSKSWSNLTASLGLEPTEVSNLHRLQRLMSGNDNLAYVPHSLLKISELAIFQSCQLLLHKRGAQNVISFLDEFNRHQKRIITVSLFNKIASTIRKSKNKRFDQSALDLPGVDILGPFLAQVIQNERYDIIIIVSHNGFLPPSDIEEEAFYQIIKDITPYLFHLTHLYELTDLSELIGNVFKSLPLKFSAQRKMLQLFNNLEQPANLKKYISEKNIDYHIFTDQSDDPSKHYHVERISLLGELLNTLKHELMNPLFGLNLGIQMLEAPENDSDTQEFLNEMLLSVSRSQNIIDNFSQLYDDINRNEKINFDVLLQEIITLTKSETKQIIKDITLASPCFLNSNKTSLSQILFNLIINAAQSIKSKYENPAQGLISIKTNIISDQGALEIHVKDNGQGISPELSEQIFSPFFTTKQDGTGLGLTICKNLLKRINGEIEIIPSLDGAYFKIIIRNCL